MRDEYEEVKKKFPWVNFIDLEENGGPGAAR